MLGQEDNHLQIGFFLKRFSLEISVLIISLEKIQNVYTWKFSFYIKADSKRAVSLSWFQMGDLGFPLMAQIRRMLHG